MDLDIKHLLMLRSLRARGWEVTLIHHLPPRCGASEEDWRALVAEGLVEERDGKFWLSREGVREYRRQSEGKWF